MKRIIKITTFIYALKILFDLFNENTTIKSQIDKLKEEITKLEMVDIDKKIKDFQNKIDGFKDNIQDSQVLISGVYSEKVSTTGQNGQLNS